MTCYTLSQTQFINMGPCHSQPESSRHFISEPLKNPMFISDELMFDNEKLYNVKLDEMELELHRNIGALLFKDPQKRQTGKGSGILISPDLVLTAAHNLCYPKTKQIFKNFVFYPKQHGIMREGYKVVNKFIPPQYFISPKPYNDYALLKLQRQVETDTFIPLNTDPKLLDDLKQIAIFGYPADQYGQEGRTQALPTVSQWGLSRGDKIIQYSLDNGYIIYSLSTLPGQSGAPIIGIDRNDKMSIIGIHKGGVEKKNFTANIGRLILPKMIQTLEREAKKLNAKMFKVFPGNLKQVSVSNLQQIDQEQDYLQKGDECYQQNKLNEAIKHYSKAFQINRQSLMACYNLATVLFEKKRYEESIKYYGKAVKLDPQNDQIHTNAGLAFLKMKDYSKAISQILIAKNLNPKEPRVHLNLGIVYLEDNQHQKAIDNFQNAIGLNQKYGKAHYNMGRALRGAGRIDEAIKYLETAQKLDPNDKGSRLELTKCNLKD